MTKFFNSKILWLPGALILLLAATFPANSRTWSHNPNNLAQDYVTINDNRGNGDVVLLFWIAPALIPEGPSTQAVRQMLDKYIVIGVVHAHASKDGTITFDRVTTLEASNKNGNALSTLDTNTMPPSVVGALASIQSLFGRSMGNFGQGIQWFALDGGETHTCTKGGFSVKFAGENYTYDTPIPGCP